MRRNLDDSETDDSETFKASHGWFDRFKRQASLHHMKMFGEAASADAVAVQRSLTS